MSLDELAELGEMLRARKFISADINDRYGEVMAAKTIIATHREVHVIAWSAGGAALSLCGYPGTYDDQFLYEWSGAALKAFAGWDGVSDPGGWWRHPSTGRRRTNGDPAKEYVQW
jgi:hypothetical protein